MNVITYQCWDYNQTMSVKGTPEILLSLKSQKFSQLPYIRACLPGGHFWGYLTGTHSFIQATHLKIGYLIFHELQ